MGSSADTTTDSKAVCGGGEDLASRITAAVMGISWTRAGSFGSQLDRAAEQAFRHAQVMEAVSAALASTAGAGAGDVARLRNAVESLNGSELWLDDNHPWRMMLVRAGCNYAVAEVHPERTPGDGRWKDGVAICSVVNEAIRLCQSPAVPASPRSGEPLSQADAAGRSERAVEIRELHAALSKGHALLCESGPDRCWVKIGFGWLQDAQDAHGALARFIKDGAPAQSPSTSDAEG